jgi:hypothetical protein
MSVSLLDKVLQNCVDYDGFYIHKDIIHQYKLAKELKLPCGYSYCETGWLQQELLRAKEGQASTGNVKGRVNSREAIGKKIILDVLVDNYFLKSGNDQIYNRYRHITLNEIVVVRDKNIKTKEMVEYPSTNSFLNLIEERREALQFVKNLKSRILKPYSLWPNQLCCFDKMLDAFNNEYSDFGMFKMPRSGKNITYLNFVKTQIENGNFKSNGNHLVISADPKIFPSMINDNTNYFGFNLIDVANDKDFELMTDRPNLLIVSKQLLDNRKNKTLLEKISKIIFETKFKDECHDSMNTKLFVELDCKLKANFAIYSSGTAFLELTDIKFDSNNTFIYSYNDYANDKVVGDDRPLIRYTQFSIKNYQLLSDKIENHSWKKYYHTDKSGKLIYEGEIAEDWGNILNYNNTYTKYSPFKIYDIQHAVCLMPPTTKGIIALAKLLNERYGDRYLFIAATGGKYKSVDQITSIIREEENGKCRKTITLTCGTFTQGTSVPEWHVLLMSDTESPYLWVQTMFRCLTKNKLGINGTNTKKFGYVCDFSAVREIAYRFDEWARHEARLKGESNPKEYLKTLINNCNLLRPNGDVEFIDIPTEELLGYITEPMYRAKSLQRNVSEFVDIKLFSKNASKHFLKYKHKMQGVSQKIGNDDFTKGKLMTRLGDLSGIKDKKKKADLQYALEQVGILLANLIKFPLHNWAYTVEDILKLDDDIFESGTNGFKKQHLELLINECGLDTKTINYKL